MKTKGNKPMIEQSWFNEALDGDGEPIDPTGHDENDAAPSSYPSSSVRSSRTIDFSREANTAVDTPATDQGRRLQRDARGPLAGARRAAEQTEDTPLAKALRAAERSEGAPRRSRDAASRLAVSLREPLSAEDSGTTRSPTTEPSAI